MAGARTRGAGADVKNHPPLLTGFRASGWSHAPGPLRPLSTKHRGSVAHNWPTLITWALALANSNSGNEIVRPETLGPARRKLSPKRRANRLLRPFSVRRLRKSRAISDLGKSRRFARTSWWRTQSGETGLRDRARLGNREKHTVDGCYCIFGVQNGGGCAFPSA